MGKILDRVYKKCNIFLPLSHFVLISLIFSLSVLFFACTALAADVTLAWDASSGADGYRLFSREQGQSYNYNSPDWEGTATTGTVTGLAQGTTYYFVVRAYNAYGESGDSNEESTTISSSNQPPSASFSATPTSGVAPLTVNFDASGSYDSDGSIVSYTWNFGDGATTTGSTVSHTYTSGSTFTVTLTVTDNDGAGAFTTGQVQVTAPNQPPSASFSATPTSGVAPLTVNFDASGSYDPDGSIVSYTWNFGDGATNTGSTVSHTYTSGNIYLVSLTVTDNDGAMDTGTRRILVTTVSNLVPDTPVPYLPVDGAANESLSPNLETESFIDPDGDTHAQTQWQISETSNFSTLVFSKISNTYLTSLTVPTSVLDEDSVYYWRVRFYDHRGGESAWSNAYWFTTEVTLNDTNSNGVPDSQEVDGTVDVDNNGIFDLDQMLSDIRFKCMNTFSGDKQIAFGGITNVASIDSVMSIDPDIVSDKPGNLPFGLVSIKLRTINPGDTALVVVYFSEPTPEGTQWYKYDSLHGWQDYSAYATFRADRKSLVLELKDGGHGDSDGVENGIIVDPGGVVGSGGGVDSGGGGGGGGCFIATSAFGI
jgi:PKD repeat protein